MSRKKIILITGANGEIGTNLIDYLSKLNSEPILSLDLQPIKNDLKVHKHIMGSILDQEILDDINAEYEIFIQTYGNDPTNESSIISDLDNFGIRHILLGPDNFL